MGTRDPYTVEVFVTKGLTPGPHWVAVLDIPTMKELGARSWLRAQGHRWMNERRWRIVDRQGATQLTVEPKLRQGKR